MERTMRSSIWDMYRIDDTREIALECIKSSRALAELKGVVRSMAIPGVTLRYIRLSEARMSSYIEGICADQDKVLRASAAGEGNFGEAVDEVIRHAGVLERMPKAVPSVETLERACSEIRGKDVRIRSDGQNVCITNGIEVLYTAPDFSVVGKLLDELIGFVTEEYRTDELITVVMAHLIFESIHPFDDGNGRTGRAFMHMLMDRYGLTDGCCLMISPSIMRHRREYYSQLRLAEETGHTDQWILFMLRMVREGAIETMRTVFSIQEIYRDVCEQCQGISFCSSDLMNVLFSNVYCKSSCIVDAGIAERITAMKYLKALEKMGILEGEKMGRIRMFRNRPLYGVLSKNTE